MQILLPVSGSDFSDNGKLELTMSSRVKEQLDRARQDLLDLTARNRLINTPLLRGRTTRLDVIDESTAEVFRLLVQEKKELSFLPVPDVEEENEAESEVDDVEFDDAENGADIDAELETNFSRD